MAASSAATSAKPDISRPFQVRVRDTAGAYVTCTINGKRASSTSGASFAVLSLAEKLLGGDSARSFIVEAVPGSQPAGVSLWLVTPIRWRD